MPALVQRFCPGCGLHTEAAHCPEDHTPTIEVGAAAAEPVVGALVDGRYRLDARIGEGGFGAVYEATHVGTLQRVALKILHRESGDGRGAQRFLREARLTAGLRCPSTVRVFDVGVASAGSMYMAMERLHGRSLDAHLRDAAGAARALSEAEACAIAYQTLESLEEAHAKGMVHRDIKPANLFLCDPEPGGAWPQVKVLDFGIAWIEGPRYTAEQAVVGSPAWMSPEQCQGRPIDGRSDLYSLGAVLYCCVTTSAPFGEGPAMSVMYSHVHAPLPDPRRGARVPVSAAFAAVVLQALAKDPAARFEDAASMRAALARLGGGASGGRSQPPPDVVIGTAGAQPWTPQAPARTSAVRPLAVLEAAGPPEAARSDIEGVRANALKVDDDAGRSGSWAIAVAAALAVLAALAFWAAQANAPQAAASSAHSPPPTSDDAGSVR